MRDEPIACSDVRTTAQESCSISPGRRRFLGLLPAAGVVVLGGAHAFGAGADTGQPTDRGGPGDEVGGAPVGFPRQDTESVRLIVGRSHFDLEFVTKAVSARPALAKAAVDHGYGDWESAIGAASHTGRREIAEVLITHGARPTLFTFAMLGDVDVVRAMVGGRPELRQLHGPHGISLLDHARAGRDEAKLVVEYLESLGDADPQEPQQELANDLYARYVGEYRYAQREDERLIVGERRGALVISTPDTFPRELRWQGGDVFTPRGATAVRIVFGGDGELAERVVVHDPEPIVTGVRL